jgi:cyclic pyranopterin phosphate synthase
MRVLNGIEAARDTGLEPIKINTVVKRSLDADNDIVHMAAFGRERGYVMRFIEYMDVGTTNGWRMDDVVPAREILDRIRAVWPVERG